MLLKYVIVLIIPINGFLLLDTISKYKDQKDVICFKILTKIYVLSIFEYIYFPYGVFISAHSVFLRGYARHSLRSHELNEM